MALTLSRNPNLSAPSAAQSQASISLDPKAQEFGARKNQGWWTGLDPRECVGFDSTTQTLRALPLLNLQLATRQDVLDYFNNSWTLTELLFAGLKKEDAYIRPPYHQLRHPLIFYFGHPAVLYLNKLRIAGYVSEPVDLYLEKVLETGVDEMSWDDIGKNEMNWPSVFTVREYRQKVYDIIKKLILTHPDFELGQPRGIDKPSWALWMGFEHEKIHFETSSVLIRELPIDAVETPKYWPAMHPSSEAKSTAIENKWVSITGGTVSYGKPLEGPSFGWDNEYGQREATLKDFSVTQFLISNKEYYEFVSSGGYVDDKYWEPEGLSWRKFRNTKRPTFWVAYGPEGLHDYKLRTIWEIIEMPWSWPAEVNFHEAIAYCHWKSQKEKSKIPYRLITEAEHVRMREPGDTVLQQGSYQKLSIKAPAMSPENSRDYNFNLKWSSPRAVNSSLPSPQGVFDVFGNVWQWAEDQFNPLEGFNVHSLYDDFSTPCFDGKHQMMLGGSFISCGHEASVWARFHFRPHFFQHAGFRMAKTLDGSSDNASVKIKKTTEYVHQKRFDALEQISGTDWWKNKLSQPLEMTSDEIQKAFSATEESVLDFYKKYSDLHPGGTSHDPRLNSVPENFKLPYQSTRNLPERSEDLQKLLKMVFEELAPLGQLPGHPGYAAYVAGAGNLISSLAQLSAMTLNPFSGHYMMAPGLVALEAEAIRWFVHLFGFPAATAQGFFTTGGSMATVSALQAARQSRFENQEWLKAVVYVSDQAHHCVAKAMQLLGFAPSQLRVIPSTRPDFKMNLHALKTEIEKDQKAQLIPFVVVGTSGTTNTGAVDPLLEISEIAEKNKMWFHIDGAYGGLFKLTEKGDKKLAGIDRANSLVFDPHKTLGMPYGTGALLVRNGETLKASQATTGSYMPPPIGEDDLGLQIDYSEVTPELSRDFRGLRVWLPLKVYGIGPFKLNLEEKLELANWFANELRKVKGVEIVAEPQLSIFAMRLESDQKTEELLVRMNKKGTLFLSSCKLDGKMAIRFCFLGFRLHFERLAQALLEMKEMINDIG